MKKRRKTNKGITLVALVITIIILLILAGIVISSLSGENGLLKRATEAKEKTEEATANEIVNLAMQNYYISQYQDNKSMLDCLIEELGEPIWLFEKTENGKALWNYGNEIIVVNTQGVSAGTYSIYKSTPNTLINNHALLNSSNEDANNGFLIDIDENVPIDKRAIARKDIKTIDITTQIPSDFNVSYDVSELRDGSIILYAIGSVEDGYDVKIVPKNGTKVYAPPSSRLLFYCCNKMTSINLENLDTSNVIDMTQMFWKCNELNNLDISNFDTSNVTSMSYLFRECNNITNINVSSLNTTKVSEMGSMFAFCSNLKEIDISSFDTTNVKNMTYMFWNCTNLEEIIIGDINVSNVTNMNSMFYKCSNLKSLDLSSFDTSKVTNMNYMFAECTNLTSVLVGDSWDDSKASKTNWFYKSGVSDVNRI